MFDTLVVETPPNKKEKIYYVTCPLIIPNKLEQVFMPPPSRKQQRLVRKKAKKHMMRKGLK
jgi:hypothetical protein